MVKGSELVDRQKRLITLCVKAMRDIRLYADMALIHSPEVYNQFFASDMMRQARKGRNSKSDTDEPEIDESDDDETVSENETDSEIDLSKN